MSSMVRLPDNEDRIRFGEIGWQSILLGIFFKSSCKLKFQEKTKKDFTWLFEALYAHARGDSMNLKKRYWIILFPPNHRIQACPMKICKLSSWIWSSKRQIMFTFHGWSYFLKNQLELGVSIMESVGLDVRKKKEKRKKKTWRRSQWVILHFQREDYICWDQGIPTQLINVTCLLCDIYNQMPIS